MVTLTATEAAPGFVTLYPSGIVRPATSTLNLTMAAETRANAAVMRTGPGGQLEVYTQAGADLLADTSGYFTA